MNARMEKGFGLIELLISILIGLIVVAGISSLVVATLRANTENLQMTRLTQEMRAVMQLTTRDLRRGGYDYHAIRDFGSGSQTHNEFEGVSVFDGGTEVDLTTTGISPTNPADCVLFSYDSDQDGVPDASEFRGFRFDQNNNAVEIKTQGAAADDDCTDGTWVALTDPNAIQVNNFGISTVDGNTVPVMTDSAGNPILTIRELVLSMEAEMVNDATIQRTMRETIRVRNDLLN